MLKLFLSALLGAFVAILVLYLVTRSPAVDSTVALASLNDRELSPTYNSAFWLAAEHAGNDLWNRAYEYCSTPANYADGTPRPNCTIVQLVRNPTVAPEFVAAALTGKGLRKDADRPVGDGVTGFAGQRAGQFPKPH